MPLGIRTAIAAIALLATLCCNRPAVVPPVAVRTNFTPVQEAFGPALKRRVIREIGLVLSSRAYAGTVDFSDWNDRAIQAQVAMDSAASPEAFSAALNTVFKGYQVSHLQVEAPSERAPAVGGFRHYGFLTTKAPESLVVRIIPGGPAHKAGILKGDRLTVLDNQPFDFKNLLERPADQIPMHLQGVRGKEAVSFSLVGSSTPLIQTPSLAWLTPEVAMIRVPSFLEKDYDSHAIQRMFREIREAKGLVLDLRFNTGGAFANARHLATHLWRSGNRALAWEVTRPIADAYRKAHHSPGHPKDIATWHANAMDFTGNRGPDRYSGPVVALTDRWTMSSAESLAAALQDLGRAKVLGMRTAGQVLSVPPDGSGEYGCPLSGGFHFLFPTGMVLTPKFRILEGTGVAPEVEMDLRSVLDDRAITARAVELLRSGKVAQGNPTEYPLAP